jgi:hypothetical protein
MKNLKTVGLSEAYCRNYRRKFYVCCWPKEGKKRRKEETTRSVVKSGTENEERGFFTMENMKSNYSIRVLENDKLYVELTDVMD